MLSELQICLLLLKTVIVQLICKNSAKRLAALGGSEPTLKSVLRRRS